jgi:hypothetical protein
MTWENGSSSGKGASVGVFLFQAPNFPSGSMLILVASVDDGLGCFSNYFSLRKRDVTSSRTGMPGELRSNPCRGVVQL